MSERRDLWPVAALLAVPLFFFRDAVLGHGVLFRRDISLVWYPQVESFVRCVALGSWPLWDPYRGFGQPLLADPSAEVLYPPAWLNLIAPPWIVYTAFVVSHLAFSGIGLYALLRRWSLSRPSAAGAAMAWMASGPFLSLASTWHHMAGAAFFPWVLLAMHRAAAATRFGGTLGLALAVAGQVLAGSADMVAMTFLVAAASLATELDWRHPGCPANRGMAARVALGVSWGLGLSAIQWLPTLEMALGTARMGLDAGERTLWSLHPLSLLEIALPFHWAAVPLSREGIERILGGREPWLHSIYLGVPALSLAILGAFLGEGRRRIVFALLAVGGTLAALGPHGPVYGPLVTVLPPLRVLRFPMKAMVPVAFCAALLTAYGLEAWRTGRPRAGGRWRAWATGPATLLTLVALGATLVAKSGAGLGGVFPLAEAAPRAAISEAFARLPLAAILAMALLVVSLARSHGRLTGHAAAIVVLALLAADLAAAHRDLHPVAPKVLFTHRPQVLEAVSRGPYPRVWVCDYSTRPEGWRRSLPEASPFRLREVPRGWTPLQALTLAALDYLTPPTPERWGVYGSFDLDLLGLQPRPLVDLNALLRRSEDPAVRTRLLRLGAVPFVVDLAPPEQWTGLAPVAEFPSLFLEPIRVYGVPRPLPRAFVVGRAITVDGDEAVAALLAPDFDPVHTVVLASGEAGGSSTSFSGNARLLDLKPDRIVVRCELSAAGHLVLVDAYAPGWRASVDGRAAPVLRANLGFRAVPVPPGLHEVRLVYRPASVELGLALSLVAAAAAAWQGIGRSRRRP
jgi:hypothetical protein